jgi:transposase
MQILAMEGRLGRAVREEEAALSGAAIEQVREVMDKHLPAWHEIQTLREKLSAPHRYPEGDVTSLVCDEPVFGEHSPPEPDEYLYHYTRAWTLPKIQM